MAVDNLLAAMIGIIIGIIVSLIVLSKFEKNRGQKFVIESSIKNGLEYYKLSIEVPTKRRDYLYKTIVAFKEALKVATIKKYPMDYAMTQNNLGTAYRTLAEVENKAENCKKSISAHEEALKVFTKDEFPEPYNPSFRVMRATDFQILEKTHTVSLNIKF